jgi:hypothetical protein
VGGLISKTSHQKPSKKFPQGPAHPIPIYPYPPGKASIIRTAPCGCSLVICTLKNLGVEKLADHPAIKQMWQLDIP